MSTGQTIVCDSACTVTVLHEIPLLSIGAADGALIGFAIVSVWAVALALRFLIRALNVDEIQNESD